MNDGNLRVVDFKPPPVEGVDETLVAFLRHMLEQARAGELRGVLVASEWKSGAGGTHCHGDLRFPNAVVLLEVWKLDYFARLLATQTPIPEPK